MLFESKRKLNWIELKNLSINKNISFQYIDTNDMYIVILFDNTYVVYTHIHKTIPTNSDQEDFEDNYLAFSNTKLFFRTVNYDPITQTEGSISPTGENFVSDRSNGSGVFGSLSVGISEAVEVKVGGSNLVNRKAVTIFNNGSSVVYWGYSNTVSSSNGTPLSRGQFASWAIGPNISIWLIASSGTQNIRISELS